jgi:hypothetical protein
MIRLPSSGIRAVLPKITFQLDALARFTRESRFFIDESFDGKSNKV